MKKLIIFCVLFVYSSYAFAELIGSVSVDTFISGEFTGNVKENNKETDLETDGSVSGVSAHVELPFLMGFGVSQIQQKLKDKNTVGVKTTYKSTMLDLYYAFDILIKLEVGVGVGSANLKRSIGSVSENKTNTIFRPFVNVGLPIFPMVSIRAGVHHLISTKFELKNKEVTVQGTAYSLGLGIGF